MSIYFIRSGNYIKIGYADDPARRLKELQTANPGELEILGIAPGNVAREREIHIIFADFRANGEWFELTTDILAYINQHCTKHRPAPPKPAGRKGQQWIEFKPGTKRKDGSRLYYPKYRAWSLDGKSKEWRGPVPGMRPMTKDEIVKWEGQK